MSSDAGQIPTSQVVESNENIQPPTPNGKDEIAHVLFLDVVGFTKLRPAKQRHVLAKLQGIVRATEDYCASKQQEQLIALPTGDGMALVFLTTVGGSGPAASCAEKVADAIKKYNRATPDEDAKINVRMGIHSGNVVRVSDVNDRPNVAGDGINTAQRVMDCGDIGHILLSDLAYRLLPADPDRTDRCLSLGKVKVKHDHEVRIYSLCHEEIGNRETPQKIRLKAEESLRIDRAIAEVQKAARTRQRRLWALAISLFAILAALLAVLPWVVQKPYSPPSLAVLPFKPVTSLKYSSRAISKGLTEDFIRGFQSSADRQATKSLAEMKSPPEPSRSVQSQSSLSISEIEACKQLNVRYCLTGTVESEIDDGSLDKLSTSDPKFNVTVRAKLYDTEAGKQVWSSPSTQTPFNQLVAFQELVIKEVSEKFGVVAYLRPEDARKVQAHWNYLLGRFWSFQRTNAQGDVKKKFTDTAIENYEAAIKIGSDPYYAALANAGLADIYLSLGGVGTDPRDAKKKALEYALAATESPQIPGEEVAEAYSAIGTEKWWLERDFSTARIAFQLAIRLNPNLADAHKRYSNCLAALGKKVDAKKEMDAALGMEPESPVFQLASGQNNIFAQEYDEAIKQLQSLISKSPKMYDAYRFLAIALEQRDRGPEALARINEALEGIKKNTGKSPDSDFLGTKAYIQARLGQTEEARKTAEDLEKSWKQKSTSDNEEYVSPYNIALIYAALPGEDKNALLWLDKAIGESDPRVNWLNVDPRFDKLRESSKRNGFDDLFRRARLPVSAG
jgi:class 3 adenylate cyclase/TolB-like protein/Tfp pilus assembly protein PilF